jgi:hypothetical protein
VKRFLVVGGTVLMLYILQSLPAYRLSEINFSVATTHLQVDIACILAVYLGVREKSVLWGAFLAYFIGLFTNAFAPTSMRTGGFLVPLFFIITYLANQAFFFKRLTTHLMLVFFVSVLYNCTFFYLMRVASGWYAGFWQLVPTTLLQALLNAIFAAMIFTFFDWITDAHDQTGTQRYRY